MNAKQRKKDRKLKQIIDIGRNAKVLIAAAEARVEAVQGAVAEDIGRAHKALAQKDDALAKTLGKARTLEEAVMLARTEAAKAAADMETLREDYDNKLGAVIHSHQEELEAQAKVLEAEGRQRLDAQFQSFNKLITDNQAHIDELKLRLKKAEKEAEEPERLRKRLQEKTELIKTLQTELSMLKAARAAEPVIVPDMSGTAGLLAHFRGRR